MSHFTSNTPLGSQSYYELLDVPPTAAPSEIHAAYQRAKQTYSPESPALYSMFTPEEAKQLLALIEEAYETLSVMPRRQEYDRQLAENHPAHSSRKPSSSKALGASDLPDFKLPIDATTGEQESQTHRPPSPPKDKIAAGHNNERLPKGFSRTRFSVYQMDPEIEGQLNTLEEFDGQFIQKVRQYKQVSMDKLSEHTKVSKAYLSAIERNDYETLPAPVFVRGFVIQIARALNVKEKPFVDAYMKFFKKNHLG